jgi:hypothetical protein
MPSASLAHWQFSISKTKIASETLKGLKSNFRPFRASEANLVLLMQQPGVFHPHLACSLISLSDVLSPLGHLPEALLAIQEAAGLCRHLATEHPALFSHDLVGSLAILSHHYSDMGCHEDVMRMHCWHKRKRKPFAIRHA